jgi:hypothetical protein
MVACREGRPAGPDLEAALLDLRLAAPGLPRSTLQQAGRDPCFAELRDGPYRAAFEDILRA